MSASYRILNGFMAAPSVSLGVPEQFLKILPFLHEGHADVLDGRVQLQQELSVLAVAMATASNRFKGGSKGVQVC